MRPLDKKLLRDLWHIRGQALAIALVIAGGVATLVMSMGTQYSLEETRQAYYERYRFAHIFAHAKRAPESLARRIDIIPGVALSETRIVKSVILDVAGMNEPVRGRLISRRAGEPAHVNDVVIRQGRDLRPDHPDEVLVHEAFAEAHELVPGDTLHGNINGRRRALRVVGIALSPEFVYAIGPGEIVPDDRRFGVIWMSHKALEAAFDLKGAFNDVTVRLTRSGSEAAVLERLDQLLEPYGGTGAYGRDEQVSDAYLTSEMEQLANLTTIMPPIFLGVAAFLLNIVISRLVQTEREQIGLMKAVGYTNAEVGWHYLKFVMAITVGGIVIGWGAGYWMGRGVTDLYTTFFRFPFLYYIIDPSVFGIGALVSIGVAALGTLTAVRRAVTLPPAIAMMPPPPTAYRVSITERLGIARWLSQPGRMVLRHIVRWPLRAGLTVVGIAMSIAILIASFFFIGAMDEMMEIYFFETERQDISLTFTEIRHERVRHAVDGLAGVISTEGYRTVAAKIRFQHRVERVGIKGLAPDAQLSQLVDIHRKPVPLPSHGIVLSDKLADLLGAESGDIVTLQALEGRRPVVRIPVSLIVKQYIGTSAYMDRRTLNRLMGDGPVFSGVDILTDRLKEPVLFERLKKTPALLSISVQRTAYESFQDMIQEHLYTMIFFYVGFASLIAVGVVYNSARISLSERARELASMRVLGFTKGEVTRILIGELAVLTFVALPVGCIFGYGLVALIVTLFETDLYRIPFIVSGRTYGFSVLVVALAAMGSAWIVARRVAGLDLIAVLKTRE